MPPKKGATASISSSLGSRSSKGLDGLGRGQSRSKSRPRWDGSEDGADSGVHLPAWLDMHVPSAFVVPSIQPLSLYSFAVTMLLVLVAHYSLCGLHSFLYPLDLIAFQGWMLSGSTAVTVVETVIMHSVFVTKHVQPLSVSPSVLAELVIIVILSIRISVRYSPYVVAVPLALHLLFRNYWRVHYGSLTVKAKEVGRHLHTHLVSHVLFVALTTAVIVAVLPALASNAEESIVDHSPLALLFVAAFSLSVCFEVVRAAMSLQTTLILSLACGDGKDPPIEYKPSIAAVASTAFWEPDDVFNSPPGSDTVPPSNSTPPVLWSNTSSYTFGDSVIVSAGANQTVYRAVGNCWPGLHPTSLYSRCLYFMFDEPQCAIVLGLIPLVGAIVLIAECVVFLRRWEVYTLSMLVLFVGVVVTFTRGYCGIDHLKRTALAVGTGNGKSS